VWILYFEINFKLKFKNDSNNYNYNNKS